MHCIDELSAADLKGKRVLVRADFNLPLNEKGEVADIFRLKQGWETIQYLRERGAKVIIVSHIGRDPEESLEPVAMAMKRYAPIFFVSDLVGAVAKDVVASMQESDIVLLENVRRDARETENDESLARELASLADLFVSDAFAAAHRAHASIVGVPKFLPSYAGLLLRNEVRELTAAVNPPSQSLAILGGAKFETKSPLIDKLLSVYGHVLITGALANDIFVARGLPVGRSLVSKELPSSAVVSNPRRVETVDVTVEREDGQARVKKPEEVEAGDKIVDMGPDTLAALTPVIESAPFILWNGPTGLYEKGYTTWTHEIARLLEKRVAAGAKVVIGGGDTIAAIQDSGVLQENLGFLSTGGGAMLEYLLKGTLPAIEAL